MITPEQVTNWKRELGYLPEAIALIDEALDPTRPWPGLSTALSQKPSGLQPWKRNLGPSTPDTAARCM
jgi:hypothetical protein